MTIKEFNELKKRYCIYDDIEDIFDFVSDLLYKIARETEETEPYATKSIEFLDKAAHEVWDLTNYISELEEE